MELKAKNLELTSKIIYYVISSLSCLFLILLSNKILDDLDRVVHEPAVSNYIDSVLIKKYKKELNNKEYSRDDILEKIKPIEKSLEIAKLNYIEEKKSFDNWIETRKAIGSPSTDKEVTERAKKLDEYSKIKQDWRNELQKLYTSYGQLKEQINELQNDKTVIQEQAEIKYKKALKKYELKVFGIRLLFVSPILFLGIFFFIKYRKHKYWPLFFGVSLFSLYAFFFGLVPYLPSYGGYVRYSVGIVLCFGIGIYLINKLKQFIEHKKEELKVSSQERAKFVQFDTAEKALNFHICPSCSKDYIMKKWEFPIKESGSEVNNYISNYCKYCGLELFKTCENCGQKNYAHLPYCSSCGNTINKTEQK